MTVAPAASPGAGAGARLAAALRRAWWGEPWHGPPLVALVGGLTARQAGAHPVAGGHSIHGLVLHMAAWCDAARGRLTADVALTAAQNFPVPEAGEAAWSAAQTRLRDAVEALAVALAEMPDDALDAGTANRRNGDGDAVWGAFDLLLGAHEHLLYHAGQIALLRRALGVPLPS